MAKKRSRIFLAACGVWVITAGLFGGIWIWGIRHAPLGQRIPDVEMVDVGKIMGQESLGQTFFAPYNGLYQIKVMLSDYGRHNTGPVYFRLKTGPQAAEALVERVIPSELIVGDYLYSLTFDPILDSAGKTYYFELEAPQATTDNAITAYVRLTANYAGGTAYRAGQPIEGDLVFNVYFHARGLGDVAVLLSQMTAQKPALWGNGYFYVGVGLIYLGLLVALALGVMRVLPLETSSRPPLPAVPLPRPGGRHDGGASQADGHDAQGHADDDGRREDCP